MKFNIIKGKIPDGEIPETPAKLIVPNEKLTVACCQLGSEVVEKREPMR